MSLTRRQRRFAQLLFRFGDISMVKPSIYDTVIIGGGIVGCAIGRELMRYDTSAVLVEKECEVGFGTSKANSGIIHAGHHTSPDKLKGRLDWEGNQMWDALSRELGFGFKRCGELTVAFDQQQIATIHELQRRGESKGIPGLEMWDRARTRREEPNLSEDIVAALYAPTAGLVNPYEACFMLVENACANGLHLATDSRVLDLCLDDGLWTVRTHRGPIRGRYIINAAGLYADQVARLAGVRTLIIRPRKGEEYLLDKRLVGLVKRIIFPCPTPVSKGILVIPTFDGTIMVGPTAEAVDDKQDLSTSMAGGEAVFAAVKRMVPGISERDCIAEFAGLRAVADSEDFVIGPTSKRGFINVAGIQSPGLTSAPAIAKLVVDVLQQEGLVLEPKDEFVASVPRPVHFASLSTTEQIDLARSDRRYAHMVCRCEFVTEGEIVDAIRRGARSLDGIKFRNRAGMGRCQGSFCGWRCMELLSQELDVPIWSVTKRGGGSWVVFRRDAEDRS